MHCVGRQDFFLSVAVFVQLSQPRTGGLVRAGSAMALAQDAGQMYVADP